MNTKLFLLRNAITKKNVPNHIGTQKRKVKSILKNIKIISHKITIHFTRGMHTHDFDLKYTVGKMTVNAATGLSE